MLEPVWIKKRNCLGVLEWKRRLDILDWRLLWKKTEKQKQENWKNKTQCCKKVLHEASVLFPDTKDFIEEKLEEKYTKENISAEEVIYFRWQS